MKLYLIYLAIITSSIFQKKEEYKILDKVLSNGVNVFYQTSDVKFWIQSIDLNSSLEGDTSCQNINSKILSNYNEFWELSHDIKSIRLDPKQLKNVKLVNEYSGNIKKVTFPIISNNLAMVLVFDEMYQLVYLLEKNKDTGWEIGCYHILYEGPLTE